MNKIARNALALTVAAGVAFGGVSVASAAPTPTKLTGKVVVVDKKGGSFVDKKGGSFTEKKGGSFTEEKERGFVDGKVSIERKAGTTEKER